MTEITKDALVLEIEARAVRQDRILVAIAGPPGSGKSTLAADLGARLGPTAAVLPMDGFHLDNEQLRHMDLLHRKGAPETFDAAGFVRLLRRLREECDVQYPTFNREIDMALPDTGHIDKSIRIVLVEGNYLLLKTPPWNNLKGLFQMTVELVVNRDELETRLIARWIDHGLPSEQAKERALKNDMVNVDLILANSIAPDFTLRTSEN